MKTPQLNDKLVQLSALLFEANQAKQTIDTQTEIPLSVCLGNKKQVICQNFKQASDIIKSFIVIHNLLASSFYKNKNIGMISRGENGIIAHVSYNGRAWKGKEGFSINKQEITNLLTNDVDQ